MKEVVCTIRHRHERGKKIAYWFARHLIFGKVTASSNNRQEAIDEVMRTVRPCNLQVSHFTVHGEPLEAC